MVKDVLSLCQFAHSTVIFVDGDRGPVLRAPGQRHVRRGESQVHGVQSAEKLHTGRVCAEPLSDYGEPHSSHCKWFIVSSSPAGALTARTAAHAVTLGDAGVSQYKAFIDPVRKFRLGTEAKEARVFLQSV